MKRLTTTILLIVAAALAAPAIAQVNVVPQVGQIRDCGGAVNCAAVLTDGAIAVNFEGRKSSYSASSTGLVPAAAATDVFCVAGSATKTVKVTQITISGTAGTLVTLPVYIAKRATADTGGTPATTLALPVAARHDSSDAAGTATLVAYTANPTINDASPGIIRAATITLGTTAAATVNSRVVWDFTDRNAKAMTLRGVAQQACVNLSGVTVSSGLLNIDIELTEE